jgi:hypothetical protein
MFTCAVIVCGCFVRTLLFCGRGPMPFSWRLQVLSIIFFELSCQLMKGLWSWLPRALNDLRFGYESYD